MVTRDLVVLIALPLELRPLLGEHALERLSGAHPRVRVEFVPDRQELEVRLPEVDALMVWPEVGVPPAALRSGTRLRWVHVLPVGVDGLLTPELVAAEHIILTSSKGPLGPLLAEHAVLLMLALARDLPGYLQQQAGRQWQRRPVRQLFGKTIAILGVGTTGGHLARICKVGFGMRVLGLARTRRDNPHVDEYFETADLHAALAQADVVTLCLALTPATDRMIDAAALAAMKPSALLINIARGRLVDEAALVEALQAGRLGGAGLDVTAVEPLVADSLLWGLPNVIITPHMAPGLDRMGEHLVDFWCENIRRFAEGEPLLGGVDRQAGY